MAENKKSFVLYCDLIHTVKKMPKDKQAELFMHILSYVNDENPKTDCIIIELTFEPIKQQLKRDLKKYEAIVERNRANGSKGGRPEKPKKPNGLNGNPKKPSEPKKADSENDSGKEIDNNIILNNSLLSEIKISDDKKFFIFNDLSLEASDEQISYFKSAVAFQKLIIKNLKEKKSPTIQVEKAKYKNFVDPIRLMFEKDKCTVQQLRDAYDYLNSPEGEFWKSNILSTVKLREKLPVLLAKKNTKTTIEAKKEFSVPNPRKRGEF